MSRKKILSLLLATSLVFSMNTMVFAGELGTETTEGAATIEATEENSEDVVGVSDEIVEVSGQVSGNSQSANTKTVSGSEIFNGKADMSVYYDSAVSYTGKKITAENLNITVSVDGYTVKAKTIKITGSKKDSSKGNTFKIKSIDTNYKKIKYAADGKIGETSVSAGECIYDSRSSEEAGERAARAALKAVKKDFNTYLKNSSANLFTYDVNPIYINNYVTYKSLQSLKVSGNSYAFRTYSEELDNTAVIKLNGSGKVTGVYVLTKGSERTNGTYTVKKVKLKKNTDYKITNSVITFDGTNINYSSAYDLTKLGAASGQNS